jgi:hypothetical protein
MSGPIRTPQEALEAAAQSMECAARRAFKFGEGRDKKLALASSLMGEVFLDHAAAIRALASRIAPPAPSPLEEIGEAAVKATLVFRARGVSDEERFAQYEAADGILSDLIDAHLARRALFDAADTILASGGLTAEGGE